MLASPTLMPVDSAGAIIEPMAMIAHPPLFFKIFFCTLAHVSDHPTNSKRRASSFAQSFRRWFNSRTRSGTIPLRADADCSIWAQPDMNPGNVLPLMLSKRAERRIASFASKNQNAGEQDWAAPWISFKAIAEYCATLRTPRKPTAGQQGKKFAYDGLIQAMSRGAFNVNRRSCVLLLVSHGGKVLSVTPNELLEAREAFDPITFEAGYLNHCWSRAGLVAAWFRQTGIPAPWGPDPRPTLSITRQRPWGAINHEADVAVIDNAIEKQARHRFSLRAAVREAISESNRTDPTGSETDRLRAKIRRRQKLREINRTP